MALTRQISHEPPQIPSRSGRQFRSYTPRTPPEFPPLLAATKPATLAEIFASMKDWMNL